MAKAIQSAGDLKAALIDTLSIIQSTGFSGMQIDGFGAADKTLASYIKGQAWEKGVGSGFFLLAVELFGKLASGMPKDRKIKMYAKQVAEAYKDWDKRRLRVKETYESMFRIEPELSFGGIITHYYGLIDGNLPPINPAVASRFVSLRQEFAKSKGIGEAELVGIFEEFRRDYADVSRYIDYYLNTFKSIAELVDYLSRLEKIRENTLYKKYIFDVGLESYFKGAKQHLSGIIYRLH